MTRHLALVEPEPLHVAADVDIAGPGLFDRLRALLTMRPASELGDPAPSKRAKATRPRRLMWPRAVPQARLEPMTAQEVEHWDRTSAWSWQREDEPTNDWLTRRYRRF